MVARPAMAQAPAETPPSSAADYAPPDYILKPPSVPPSFADRAPRSMTIAEAIEIALRNNLDLGFEREQVRIVDANRLFALSNFEPSLALFAGRQVSQSPPANVQQGSLGQVFPITVDTWNLSLGQTLPSGTALTLSFFNSRTDSGAANVVAPILFNSNLTLGLSQPLLNGFSFDGRVQWAPVLKARFNSELERESARLWAMSVVKQTEDAYWGLVLSWKAYEVSCGMYERAEKQFELTRRKIAAGIQPDSELIGAQVALAQRRVEVVTAEALIETNADALRQILNLPAEQWGPPLLPQDVPRFERVVMSFESAWPRALAARPELAQALINRRISTLDLEVARNSRLPILALGGTVGAVGEDTGYGRTLDQVGNRSGWQWGVNLSFNWAPLQVGARGSVRQRQAILRQRELTREQVLTQIRVDVRSAIRAIAAAERRLKADAEWRRLAEHNLDLSIRRFQNGIQGSGNFEITQRQNELANAQQAELTTLIDHQRARTFLQMAIGELLESRHLRFEVGKAP